MSQARMYPSALFLLNLQQFCPFWWVMVHVYSPISTEEGFNSSPQGLPQKLTKQSLDFREAPFWNVLVLYGHCPNSFRPPPSVKLANVGKKVPQTILAGPYTTPPPYEQCLYGNRTFQKRGFPNSLSDIWICGEQYMYNCSFQKITKGQSWGCLVGQQDFWPLGICWIRIRQSDPMLCACCHSTAVCPGTYTKPLLFVQYK